MDDAGRRTRWTRSRPAGSRSIPSATPRATSTGWARSATGASAGSSGGATGSRSGHCDRATPRPSLQRRLRAAATTSPVAAFKVEIGRLARSVRETRSCARRCARMRTCAIWIRQDPDVLDTWFSSALWPHLDPRLARGNRRAQEVLPDERPLDGPRHHHALGRADGDLRPVQHAATSRSATSSSTR